MHRSLPAVGALVLLLLDVGAQAADCTTGSSQSDLNICADQAYRKSDAELNALYKRITERLKTDPAAAKLLVEAQKSWVAFRDAECAFSASGAEAGSIYPMIVVQCRDGLTTHRIKDFQRYLKCEEGDMSCPVPAN